MKYLNGFAILVLLSSLALGSSADRCEDLQTYTTDPTQLISTLNDTNHYYDVQSCAGVQAGEWRDLSGQAVERIFQLRVSSPCTLNVHMSSEVGQSNFNDPSPYVTSVCPDSDPDAAVVLDPYCEISQDNPGSLVGEDFEVSLVPGQDYFLFVDGYGASEGLVAFSMAGCELISPIHQDAFESN